MRIGCGETLVFGQMIKHARKKRIMTNNIAREIRRENIDDNENVVGITREFENRPGRTRLAPGAAAFLRWQDRWQITIHRRGHGRATALASNIRHSVLPSRSF